MVEEDHGTQLKLSFKFSLGKHLIFLRETSKQREVVMCINEARSMLNLPNAFP